MLRRTILAVAMLGVAALAARVIHADSTRHPNAPPSIDAGLQVHDQAPAVAPLPIVSTVAIRAVAFDAAVLVMADTPAGAAHQAQVYATMQRSTSLYRGQRAEIPKRFQGLSDTPALGSADTAFTADDGSVMRV